MDQADLYQNLFWVFVAVAVIGVSGMVASLYLEKKNKKAGHDQNII